MSADLQSSNLKNISEAKLCEYPVTDKLIEKVTFEADSLKGKSGTLKGEASITKREADSLKGKPETLKGEAESLKLKDSNSAGESSEKERLLILLSDETRSRIKSVGKRTNPENMEQTIREICSQKDFTLDELCIILGRKNSKTLYDNYIKKLLNEKKLIKTNPDKPTYPNQKYRTVLSQKEKSK